MMRIVLLILVLLGAQFTATAFVPTQPGKGWILWPFAADTKSWLGFTGGVPQQSNGVFLPLLAGLAGIATLGFLAAAASLLGILVPAAWWPYLVPVAAIASLVLQIVYAGPLAILPILLDAVLLWGVLIQHWTPF